PVRRRLARGGHRHSVLGSQALGSWRSDTGDGVPQAYDTRWGTRVGGCVHRARGGLAPRGGGVTRPGGVVHPPAQPFPPPGVGLLPALVGALSGLVLIVVGIDGASARAQVGSMPEAECETRTPYADRRGSPRIATEHLPARS